MKFKFKEGVEVSSSEPYYDLTDGGYIKPEDLLKHPAQARRVVEAIEILRDFLHQAEDEGVLVLY
jgi:hypothetical protein